VLNTQHQSRACERQNIRSPLIPISKAPAHRSAPAHSILARSALRLPLRSHAPLNSTTLVSVHASCFFYIAVDFSGQIRFRKTLSKNRQNTIGLSGCHAPIGAWTTWLCQCPGKYLDGLSRCSGKNKAIMRWVFHPLPRPIHQRWTWVRSIHGLGWVGSHFPAHVIGWVGLGEEKRTLVHLCYTCPAQWKKCCYAPATKVGEFSEGCAHSPLGPLSSPLLLPIPCL